MKGREVQLVARPHGEPRESDFRLVEVDVPGPGDGQVLVRNDVMSVDPYMRGRMDDVPSYVPPFRLNAPLEGGAVGQVIESRSTALAVGDSVLHRSGWRSHAVGDAGQFRKLDVSAAAAYAYLGVLGMPGLTAYVGLLDIAGLREGDVVFVSGAAGAVGSMASQIAQLRGHRVIGSAGSAAKVAYLRSELGLDAAFNYKDGPVADQLAAAAPEGIDVYFDNVGGEHLEAAIGSMRRYGRIAACGAVSQYNATAPTPAPRNLALMVGKRLRMQGFIVGDHNDRMPDFVREVGGWLLGGRIRHQETFVDGLENAPRALIGLLRGENIGKMLVRLS